MSGAAGRVALWPWLGLLVFSLVLTSALAWQILPAALNLPSLQSRPPAPRPTPRPASVEQRRVRLFFPQKSGETLRERDEEIPRRGILADQVRAVLRELTTGMPDGRPPIPPGAEVRQVFLDGFGILYLDFSEGFHETVGAPGAQPDQTISAVVTTLTTSFSEIKRVQFLIEGREMTVTAGGWDLRRPIVPRFPGEEVPPAVSQPRE